MSTALAVVSGSRLPVSFPGAVPRWPVILFLVLLLNLFPLLFLPASATSHAPAPPPATALEKSVTTIQGRIAQLLGWIRNFLFVCAGGAFLAVFATWFTGRPNIKWLITLVVALVLLALVSVIITYFVDTTEGAARGADTTPLEDALQN